MGTNDVFMFMKACEQHKRELGKESTADLYRASMNHMKQFVGKKKMQWPEITKELIDKFKEHLERNGLEENSVNSYLSNSRAMYNQALSNNVAAKPEIHPFAHLHLQRKITFKRAVPQKVNIEIMQMNFKKSPELKQVADWYIFSYLACGMPFIDLAHLTKDNIQGNEIVYRRRKTDVLIRIGITPGMRIMLEQYKRKGSKWLFPILPEGKITHKEYKTRLKQYNIILKKIGQKLKEPIKLTSYIARHSWATDALQHDLSIAVIGQALGHKSQNTTQIYLSAISQEKINKENWKVTKTIDKMIKRIA